MIARAKYDAWKAVGAKVTSEQAKLAFIDFLKSKQPNFNPKL